MSASPKLADSLDLGPVHITVTDLDRSVGFTRTPSACRYASVAIARPP
jgi:hypothetical protein